MVYLERKREFEKEFRSCTKFHKQMLKTTGISVIEAFQQASDTTWALMANHCISLRFKALDWELYVSSCLTNPKKILSDLKIKKKID